MHTVAPVLRTFGQSPPSGMAPDAPTLSLVDDGTGVSFTATIGNAAGLTAELRYRERTSLVWLDGGQRSGNGTIQVTGLTAKEWYVAIAYNRNGSGFYSEPSDPAEVRVTDGTDDPLLIAIANAVVDELNGQSWTQTFTAAFSYQPTPELKDLLDTLVVTVVPREQDSANLSRTATRTDYVVDISVQKKPTGGVTAATSDPLVLLVEEFMDYFLRKRLADPDAMCVATENEPVYIQEHVQQYGQFTSVVSLSFRYLA